MIILIFIFLVLGFLYAWIAGIVSREEISIGAGVVTVLLAGIFGALAKYPLPSDWGGLLIVPIEFAISFVMLTLMGKMIAKLEWKHSAIIALAYGIVISMLSFGLGAIAGDPTPVT